MVLLVVVVMMMVMMMMVTESAKWLCGCGRVGGQECRRRVGRVREVVWVVVDGRRIRGWCVGVHGDRVWGGVVNGAGGERGWSRRMLERLRVI